MRLDWLILAVCTAALLVLLVRVVMHGRELARAQDELKLSEERYRLLFERNMDGVIICERRGPVLLANDAAHTIFRAPAGDLLGRSVLTLVDATDDRQPRLAEQVDRVGQARGEMRLLRPDGTGFEAEVDAIAYQDSSGKSLASIVFRDVTERNRTRAELVSLNASLEERVRQRTAQLVAVNRELESFSYTVAHDLRSPLVAIDAFRGALASGLEGKLSEREVHYLDRIHATTQQMSEMVDALLDLARMSRTQLEPESVDLSEMAQAIFEQCRMGTPTRQVAARVEEQMWAFGDRRLLHMVLENLIGNAWKFTGKREDAAIEFSCHQSEEGRTVYVVRDNGVGFAMDQAQRLFTPFHRMHRQADFAGHGIGLANVSRIVALHGGDIWARAEPGQGASFFFTLDALAA